MKFTAEAEKAKRWKNNQKKLHTLLVAIINGWMIKCILLVKGIVMKC